MNNDYLSRLDADVQEFVQRVEHGCGFEIGIEIDPERDTLACHIEADSAAVVIPGEDLFPSASVRHELTHINRILVEGVPRLAVGDARIGHQQFEKGLADLDNTIEHLCMLPEELQRYPQRLVHWQQRVLLQLPGLAGNHLSQVDKDFEARKLYVLAVLGIRNAQLTERVEAAVHLYSTVPSANQLIEAVRQALPDKAAVARVFAQAFEFPDQAVELEYLDPKSGEKRFEPLFAADIEQH